MYLGASTHANVRAAFLFILPRFRNAFVAITGNLDIPGNQRVNKCDVSQPQVEIEVVHDPRGAVLVSVFGDDYLKVISENLKRCDAVKLLGGAHTRSGEENLSDFGSWSNAVKVRLTGG